MLRIGKQVAVFDGGFGSEIDRLGLPCDNVAELNITHAEEIKAIHRAYSAADFITANSFGINRLKYHGNYSIASLARAAVENARAAGKKVFFDVGPTGMMCEPIGTLSFDEAYDAFAEIADITGDLVDGYIVETFSDLYELKACVLALKEHTNKPIFATMTFDETGRTLTGSTPEIATLVLQGLGVRALGVNCSLGPKELLPIVERLLSVSEVPVIVQPNRGLPSVVDGKATYTLGIDEFESYIKQFLDMGVSIVGGCCGTTPEFIERIAKYKGQKVNRRKPKRFTAVCSATNMTVIDGVKICGERLNPTGKKKLKEAIEIGDYDYLVGEAMKQEEAGADLLDLNVGIPRTDEPKVMKQAVKRIQQYTYLPLQIDSSDPRAIEAGVRYCNGLPLINSINGEEESLERVLPIAKKYGAVVLGLTMDGRGVPKTAEQRREIAKKIIAAAKRYGIPKHKVMIDTLVLTASAEQELVKETLRAVTMVRRLGVKTALGVSNVSFGLPNRQLLNGTFLAMALSAGLNMPIINPLDIVALGTVRAFDVLQANDKNAAAYIDVFKDYTPASATAAPSVAKTEVSPVGDLFDAVCKGLEKEATELTEKQLSVLPPMEIINDILIKALEKVGKLFDEGKLFLPQLICSAQAAKAAFGVIALRFPKSGADKGKVVLATVKGDVHDIGKNIVKVVLESYGYKVIDLGKDVPSETVVEACKKNSPIAVGLSALMTTTVQSMEQTIKAIKSAGCTCPVFVGGAVLAESIAKQIGADCYTRDALGFVKTLESVTAEKSDKTLD